VADRLTGGVERTKGEAILSKVAGSPAGLEEARAESTAPSARPMSRWVRRPRLRQDASEALSAYLFLTPWLIGMVFITIGPILGSLYLSFTSYSAGGGTPEWIGLDNFRRMFTDDPRYLASVKVTLLYVGASVPALLAFALILAMVLNTGVRGLPIYRALFYVPSLLGGSVAIAVLWRQVFGGEGLLNNVLAWFGIEGPSYIATPQWAPWTLVVLNVWTFGAPMIIFLAGLRQIPSELYDAASVDGAGRVRKFLHITLPQLSPVMLFNAIITMIGAFQAFTGAYVISNGTGGPVDSTLFYTLYLYQSGFSYYNFGYASAMAWVLLVAIALLTALMFLSSRRWVFYGDER
jgi:multiple sugar transport system permease protein